MRDLCVLFDGEFFLQTLYPMFARIICSVDFRHIGQHLTGDGAVLLQIPLLAVPWITAIPFSDVCLISTNANYIMHGL